MLQTLDALRQANPDIPFNRWGELYTAHFGDLPVDYLVIDFETTGLSREQSLPWLLGWCLVRDREVVSRGEQHLDWSRRDDLVDTKGYLSALRRIESLEKDGHFPWHGCVAENRRLGKDPEAVLDFVVNLLVRNSGAGADLVGQNLRSFDVPILCNCVRDFLCLDITVPDDELLDIGLFEKALQARGLPDLPYVSPQPGETRAQYQARVHGWRLPGVRWNIEHAVKRAGVGSLLNNNLHGSSEEDSYACHLILEANR